MKTSDVDDVRTIEVHQASGTVYPIAFAPLADAPALLTSVRLDAGPCLVVTDENVSRVHGQVLIERLVAAGWSPTIITLPAGETTKSLERLADVYDRALSAGIERNTPLFAVGGGVVGDLAGFAAATLLRGIPLVQVPTTLIAQVDSAIGGKTGINHKTGKNLIGAFHQPRLVLVDVEVLQSLPEREWSGGLAEVVKHGLIADKALFEYLERHWQQILARESDVVRTVVAKAAAVKTDVVRRDEREEGLRAILNFGHTFGHAIERVFGYGTYTHGEAVAAGMRAALHLSRALRHDFPFERADHLVARIPVPSGLARADVRVLVEATLSDKKMRRGSVRYVLLERIGKAYVAEGVDPGLVEDAWHHAQAVVG